MTNKKLVGILKNSFVFLEKYDNGDEANKYIFNDEMTGIQEVKDACYNAKMEIDDYHYQWFANAFEEMSIEINEAKNIEEAKNAIESMEFEIEADIYTFDLTKWLHSNVNRVYYLTQAIEEFEPRDGFALLTIAQDCEMREVYEMARNVILELIN